MTDTTQPDVRLEPRPSSALSTLVILPLLSLVAGWAVALYACVGSPIAYWAVIAAAVAIGVVSAIRIVEAEGRSVVGVDAHAALARAAIVDPETGRQARATIDRLHGRLTVDAYNALAAAHNYRIDSRLRTAAAIAIDTAQIG